VCGNATLKNYLINRARTFLFSTALPPYLAAQIGTAVLLARSADAERARLKTVASKLREELRSAGWGIARSESQIVPVILGENEAAIRFTEELGREGFAVRAIRPPTVAPGTARLRLSLTCALTDDQIVRLVPAMARAKEKLDTGTRENVASAGRA
jgi:8-amino-7-oxononanoate synthase